MPRAVPPTLPRPKFPDNSTHADRVHKATPRSPKKPDSPTRKVLFAAAVVVMPPAPAPPPAQQG